MKGLETFFNANGISQEIDIRAEIDSWRREHGSNPTIVVDVKEFIRVFSMVDEGGNILGGRFSKMNEILEFFFGEMKKSQADLVFIMRLNDGRYRDIDEYLPLYKAYDCIRRGNSLQRHLEYEHLQQVYSRSTLRPSERITYNLLHTICSKYGKLYVKYRFGKRSILRYAEQHNVMAVITRNTEYFACDFNFQFWSLSGVQFCDLKILKFDQQKLNEIHGLDIQQIKILDCLSELEPYIKKRLIGIQDDKFWALCTYVKNKIHNANDFDVNQLTELTEEEQERVADQLQAKVRYFSDLKGDWNEESYHGIVLDLTESDENFTAVLKYCQENLYFAYKFMNGSSTQMDLYFIDVRPQSNLLFINSMQNIQMKLLGVLFKDIDLDMQPKTRNMTLKQDPKENAMEIEMDIIYPTMALPSLNDLMINEEDQSMDDIRWTLFQWTLNLGEEAILTIRNSEGTKYIRIVLMTLNFLLSNGFISKPEADNILLTEWEGQSKSNVYVPRNRPPPPIPNSRYPPVQIAWVQAAHKYTISFEIICHCLEICGLRKQTDLIQFDAIEFHKNMGDREKVLGRIQRMMNQLQINL